MGAKMGLDLMTREELEEHAAEVTEEAYNCRATGDELRAAVETLRERDLEDRPVFTAEDICNALDKAADMYDYALNQPDHAANRRLRQTKQNG